MSAKTHGGADLEASSAFGGLKPCLVNSETAI